MSVHRSVELQEFLDAALAAFAANATSAAARTTIERIHTRSMTPGHERTGGGHTLPVCAHLEPALITAGQDGRFHTMLDAFRKLLPRLDWRPRPRWDAATASANFPHGHANAMILGPGGIEEEPDAWLGLSLLAPQVRYPDHNHPPEEVYLVMSDGHFRQENGAWFVPGIGGSFYNSPGILHAMRSGEAPLLAFWGLWNG
ncbi:dimethylsulfonioproprionate lyase family protein [Komagataeibacter sp. FNDCF1]|uniref:dimethylsulfonioproprionate lyase family protein n=1 Tax=Komagataeibacter sp. FNDCF1 TaxID=2878681 RepID=UPI001E36EC55|nr:dimethylsulfonioproprionate lyase family protein [Komagataeibacter sp. FNDCF1]MCE2565220.1 dimethylsulfoniopropionate lyase [Komagataeibacter sp. FNDCF1]